METENLDNKDKLVKDNEYMTLSFNDLFKFIISFSLIACLAFIGVQLGNVNKTLQSIDFTNNSALPENTGSNQSQDNEMAEYEAITREVLNSEYGLSHTLDTKNMSMQDMFALDVPNDEYYVFFYMTSCAYCHMSMPYIQQYIDLGLADDAPLFFAEISGEGADKFWSLDGEESSVTPDEFTIVGTPTLLHKASDGSFEAVIGPNEIASMLGV